MAINVNFTSPGTPPQSSDAANFISRADAFVSWISTFVSQLVSFVTQANALEQNVNAKEASAVQANSDAQIAMNTAIAASGATQWISGASYLVGAVHWSPLNGLSYRSKTVHNGVTTDPSLDTTNWFGLGYEPSIDEKVSHLSVTTSTYNTDGTLATMTYTGGYKTLYAYASGNLSTVQYTDTDGVTVLLTETMGYTSGNLTTVTRS